MCMVRADITRRVLEVIRQQSPRPMQLMELLEPALRYRDIQDALLELLESGTVTLSSDRRLSVCASGVLTED